MICMDKNNCIYESGTIHKSRVLHFIIFNRHWKHQKSDIIQNKNEFAHVKIEMVSFSTFSIISLILTNVECIQIVF
jgi:hypothetical protein